MVRVVVTEGSTTSDQGQVVKRAEPGFDRVDHFTITERVAWIRVSAAYRETGRDVGSLNEVEDLGQVPDHELAQISVRQAPRCVLRFTEDLEDKRRLARRREIGTPVARFVQTREA